MMSETTRNAPIGLGAELQVPSGEWLELYGLNAQRLTLDQILAGLGFPQSTDHVGPLPHSVQTQQRLFPQHSNSAGKLCAASPEKIHSLESLLVQAIDRLRARLEWLNSGSRLAFGVIQERRVILLVCSYTTEVSQLQPFLDIARATLREQFINCKKFNIVKSGGGADCWQEKLVESSTSSVEQAVEWVGGAGGQSTSASLMEAVDLALADREAEAVYLLVHGEAAMEAYGQLLGKAQASPVPIHVVVFECPSTSALYQYRQLASATGGRCHTASTPSSPTPLPDTSIATTPERPPGSGQSSPTSASPTPLLPRDDVLQVWAELERARHTLTELQALQLQEGVAGSVAEEAVPMSCEVEEDYLTSAKWLKAHGLRANKLMFEDLVASVGFRHCSGVIDLYKKPGGSGVELVPSSKVVHAQYCKGFVHVRWKDNAVMHVMLGEKAFANYRSRVTAVVEKCREKIQWLRQGSRELFGTLLEDRVVLVVDTSSSLRDRLPLLKRKLHQLIEEQLCHKQAFTVLQFGSSVHAWSERLVTPSQENLQAVWHWVQGLAAQGSTNTQAALSAAMSVPGAQAVYLLTDGRPDQQCETLLAAVQTLPPIPIHTISFNCADSRANVFLSKLASITGGRYHYYSEDVSDLTSPAAHQSEDIKQLESEVTMATEQLCRAAHLLKACQDVKGREGGATRPASVRGPPPAPASKKPRKFMNSRKWLETNSLVAKRLTLMDALGPTAVPHTAKHVPVLDKHVTAKVTLINPNGVDLTAYQQQLEQQSQTYWHRLTHLAWTAIPEERRGEVGGVSEGVAPPYQQHRAALRELMAELGWPRPQKDFDLLEAELALLESYQQQAQALQEEARAGGVASRGSTHSSEGSLAALLDQLQRHTSPVDVVRRRDRSPQLRPRAGKVIARSNIDGFYYPAVVLAYPDRRHAVVRFTDGRQQSTFTAHILPLGGANPCPSLKIGDHVLVRVRNRTGPHPSQDGSCDYYVPGEVRVLPSNPRKGHALHSIVVFSGKSVTATRRDLIKISQAQHSRICSFIHKKLTSSPGSQPWDACSDSGASLSQKTSESPSPPPMGGSSRGEGPLNHTGIYSASSQAKSATPSPTGPEPPGQAVQQLLQAQQSQVQQLEHHQSAIATLQVQQQALQEQLAKASLGPSAKEATSMEDNEDTTQPSAGMDWITSYLPPFQAEGVISYCDQGVNTEPWMEDKGLCTDPIMESRGVGTEWSSSEPEDEVDAPPESLTPHHPPRDPPESLTPHHPPDTTLESALYPEDLTTSARPPPSPRSHPTIFLEQQVLARWPDDGWYYRGTVVQKLEGNWLVLEDANGDTETIHRDDIITDLQDSQQPLTLGSPVVGLHPKYSHSYAPGQIAAVDSDGFHCTVEFYDGSQALLPRHELYTVPQACHKKAMDYLHQCEWAWVGKAVIARRDSDGMYYPGNVLRQQTVPQQYEVQWAAGGTQVQEVIHMFGPPTRRRALRLGDLVLALADSGTGRCLPGEISGVHSGMLTIQFYNRQIRQHVAPTQCFWLPEEYYHSAVSYIHSKELTSTDTEATPTPSEYTASYSNV